MSAAFALDFSGTPAPCSYPRCTLEAFHDGEHEIPRPKFSQDRIHSCVECGARFAIYGEADSPVDRRICDKPECLLSLAKREARDADPFPLMCNCPQREYPHEIAVHTSLRYEALNPKLRYRWPWSLMLSPRVEPSTEREIAK